MERGDCAVSRKDSVRVSGLETVTTIRTSRTGAMGPLFRSGRFFRICFWCFVILLTSGLALRFQAAMYGSRIVSTVNALSSLQIGETSKADTLSRIPSLRSSGSGPYGAPNCDADECFSTSVTNGFPGRVLLATRNRNLSWLLRWWGFRFEGVGVWVNFRSGKVSYTSYHLIVSAPGVGPAGVPPPPSDGELGAVIVYVSSQSIIHRRVPNSSAEEHSVYWVIPARGAPSQSVGINLTPDAPREVVRAAFDLRLKCLWSFGGCRRWNELLPSVRALDPKRYYP